MGLLFPITWIVPIFFTEKCLFQPWLCSFCICLRNSSVLYQVIGETFLEGHRLCGALFCTLIKNVLV